MADLLVLDGNGSSKYMKAEGDGTTGSPLVVEHKDSGARNKLEQLNTAIGKPGDTNGQDPDLIDGGEGGTPIPLNVIELLRCLNKALVQIAAEAVTTNTILNSIKALLLVNTENSRFRVTGVGSTEPDEPEEPDDSGDFSPSRIPGLLLWLKADAGIITDTTSGSTTISQWQDQSGNNNHAIQTVKTKQPIAGDSINGLPTIRCNGSAYLLGNTSVTGSAISAFAVIKRLGTTVPNAGYFSLGTPDANDADTRDTAALFIENTENSKIRTFRDGSSLGEISISGNNQSYLWYTSFDGSHNQIEINNVMSALVPSAGNFNANRYSIGKRYYNGNDSEFGKINAEFGEILLYNSADPSIKPLIKSYLNSKWGL